MRAAWDTTLALALGGYSRIMAGLADNLCMCAQVCLSQGAAEQAPNSPGALTQALTAEVNCPLTTTGHPPGQASVLLWGRAEFLVSK